MTEEQVAAPVVGEWKHRSTPTLAGEPEPRVGAAAEELEVGDGGRTISGKTWTDTGGPDV